MVHPVVFLSAVLLFFPPLVFLSWIGHHAVSLGRASCVRPAFARASFVCCATIALFLAWHLAR